MDVMQLRRGLMMGMGNGNIIDIFRRLNVFKGRSFVRGFISTVGTISSANTPEKEVCSELMENPFQVDDGFLVIGLYEGERNSNWIGWAGIGFYDANGDWITRQTTSGWKSNQIGDKWISMLSPIQMPYSGGFIRVSARTYGEAELFGVSMNALMEELLVPYGIAEHIDFNNVPNA